MTMINLEGFNTQVAPMDAITEVLEDWDNGFVSGIEALRIIKAVTYEWNH